MVHPPNGNDAFSSGVRGRVRNTELLDPELFFRPARFLKDETDPARIPVQNIC